MISNRVTVARRTIQTVYSKSGRAGGKCPRGGYIRLTGDDGTINYAKTVCKTWRCLPCRRKLVSLVRMKLEYGLSQLEGCLFITLTLRLAKGMLPEDVPFVQAAWRALLSRLKKVHPLWKKMKWFKVIEFTRSDQPHLHLIFQTGTQGSETISCLKDEKDERWSNRAQVVRDCPLDSPCVHHRVATAWLHVTGSWVIDVQTVKNAADVARYLCKYLTKSLTRAWDETVKSRRWAKSNNWPKLEPLRYAGSDGFHWKAIEIISGYDDELEEEVKRSEERGDPLMQQIGSQYVKDWNENKMRIAAKITITKMLGIR